MTTYSINLDDVDLALLPLRTSYNHFLKKEHYQFEVIKTVTFEVPEPSLLYTCHICAINMPAAFAREHAASIKHRANARIASIAAQRMCALITALPPPSAQPTARFCTNCATVADDDHYKTREHQDAVTYDTLLWDLVKAYAKDDDSKYDRELSNNQRNQNKDIEENNIHKEDDVEFKNGDTYNKDNNDMVAKSLDKNKLTSSNPNIISESQLTYPYEITATEHVRCVVCDCKVSKGKRNREEHIKGLRHRSMVISQNHITEQKEDEEEEQIEKNNEIHDNLERYSEDEEFSDDNNQATDVEEKEQIAEDREIINEGDNNTSSNRTKADNRRTVDSQIEYPYQVTATGRIECVICQCQVPSGEKNRNEHINGRRHRNMAVNKNPVIESREDEEHIVENCELNDNLEEHSEKEEFSDNNNDNTSMNSNITEINNRWALDPQIEYPYEVTATGHLRCLVCECRVPSGEQNRDEHVKGRRHLDMKNRATASIEEEEQHITKDCEIKNNFDEYSEVEELSDGNNDNNSVIYTNQRAETSEEEDETVEEEEESIEEEEESIEEEEESIEEEEEEQSEESDREIDDSFEEYSEDEEFRDDNKENIKFRPLILWLNK